MVCVCIIGETGSIAKLIFFIANVVLTIIGLVCAIVGGVVVSGYDLGGDVPDVIQNTLQNDFATSAGGYVLVSGGLVMLFAVFGIVSITCCKNVATLYVYSGILFILGAVTTAMGVFFMLADNVLTDAPLVGSDFEKAVQEAMDDQFCEGTLDADEVSTRESTVWTFYEAFDCECTELTGPDAPENACADYYTEPADVCLTKSIACKDKFAEWVTDKSDIIAYVLFGMGGSLIIASGMGAYLATKHRNQQKEVPL